MPLPQTEAAISKSKSKSGGSDEDKAARQKVQQKLQGAKASLESIGDARPVMPSNIYDQGVSNNFRVRPDNK